MPFKPVDTAIKVIVGPAIDDSDFKTREEALTYDQAGMEVDVILEKYDGTVTTTAVTPTTGGNYDWAHTDQGYYELELPASGGASYNNTEEGILRVVVYCTGVLPFSSVAYDIVPVKVYNSLVAGSDNLEVDAVQWLGTACATPTTAGVPEVDITHVGGTAVPATSGKLHILDDEGNPVANEAKQDIIDANVDAILVDTGTTLDGKLDTIDANVDAILVDTGTTLDGKLDTISGYCDKIDDATDGLTAIKAEVEGLGGAAMRGTDNAATAAALSTHDGKLDTVDANVDTLITRVPAEVAQKAHLVNGTGDITPPTNKGIWDALGDGTDSLNSIDTKIDTVDTVVDAIKAVTDNLPDSGALTTITGYVDCLPASLNDPSAASIADAVWDEATTGHVTAGTFGEQCKTDIDAILVDTSTTLDGKINTVDTVVDGIKAVTDNLPDSGALTTITGYVDCLPASLNDPTAAAIADAIWDEAQSGHTSVGTFGYYLDAQVSAGVSPPTVAQIADGVWDEAIADHLGAGSTGAALNGASAPTAAQVADAVWDEPKADHTTSTTFGDMADDLDELELKATYDLGR